MEKYKFYLIGLLLLLAGIAIGWFSRPMPSETHVHASGEDGGDVEVWTCSMHPQVRQEEPGICPICEMDLIPLDNSGGGNDPTILKMTEEAVKLAQIETMIIGQNLQSKSGESGEAISVNGTIEMDERTIKAQTAHIGGRIEQMDVTFEGQYIRKGQKIATIYSTELLAASEELITASNFDDRIEGLKDAAVQKLKNWKITDEQIQNILNNKKPIATIDLYADENGYVLKKLHTQGDYVRQGESLYTVGRTENLWMVFDVFESDLGQVRTGQSINFTTAAIPGKTFQSKITYINPILDNQTRTATVRAEIRNSGNLLKPGMLIKGSFLEMKRHKPEQEIYIPNSAILWTGERSVVYVQIEDEAVPTYQFREVKVGSRGRNTSRIDEGLKSGERIVKGGAFSIDAAAQLSNNFSMMNRNVSIKKSDSDFGTEDYRSNVTDLFLSQIDQVVLEYLDLKDALVDTDAELSAKEASQMLEDLEKVDMKEVSGEGHVFWMEKYRALKAHGEKIANAKSDVEEQRNQFDFLSEAIISTLKAFGTNNKEYFVQFCPMAKNDQGANWISTADTIRNPYFGDKMMKCGVVKLTLN